jgi:hypothetical protein
MCPINLDSEKHADKDVDRDLAFKAAFEMLSQEYLRAICDPTWLNVKAEGSTV